MLKATTLVLMCSLTSFSMMGQGYPASGKEEVISLEGVWKFGLDPSSTGVSSNGVRLMPALAEEIRVVHEWDKKTKEYLRKGGTVLLLADTARVASDADPVFSGISWNTVWSGMPPNLLGILCDPGHPALKLFPTEFHSNWQWWDIVRHSKPMVLDHLPLSLKPIVQMIPDWNNPRKLGLVFEAKVGKGKLLLSSVDFRGIDRRPVAAQLLYSLETYVAGPRFQPADEVSFEMIDRLFKK